MLDKYILLAWQFLLFSANNIAISAEVSLTLTRTYGLVKLRLSQVILPEAYSNNVEILLFFYQNKNLLTVIAHHQAYVSAYYLFLFLSLTVVQNKKACMLMHISVFCFTLLTSVL